MDASDERTGRSAHRTSPTPSIELVSYPSRSYSPAPERESATSSIHALDKPYLFDSRSCSPTISRATSLRNIAPADSGAELDAKPLPRVDGGKDAWLFVASAWVLETMIWGYSFTFGIVQVYLNTHPPFDTASIAAVSSVGTVGLAMQYILPVGCILVFRRYPDKARAMLWTAMIVSCTSMLISSWATKVWHLIILQGVICGTCGAVLYAPVLLWLQEWFVERRGAASGIIFSGTGVGGFVFPFLIGNLLDKVGFAWTVRIWAGFTFITFGLALLFLKPRLPARRPTRGEARGKFMPVDLTFLKSPIVWIMCATTFISSLSFFPVSLYIPTFTLSVASPLSANVVLAVYNAASVFGQVGVGYVSDRYSYPVIISIIGVCCSLTAFLSWGFADTLGKVFGFVILFGSFSGICSVWSAVARDVSGTNPQTSSLIFCCFGIWRGIASIVGPLVASSLYDKNNAFEEPPKDDSPLCCSGCRIAIYCSIDCQKQAWPGHRLNCLEVTLPHLLVLLSESPHVPLHPQAWDTAVRHHAMLTSTNSTESALASLAPPGGAHSPDGVLICGDSLFHADPVAGALRNAVVAFVERGGRAVVCGGSISSERFDVLREFLDSMGIKWQLGVAWRTTFEYNPNFANGAPPLSDKTTSYLTRKKTRPTSPLVPGGGFGRRISPQPADNLSYFSKGVHLLGVPDDEALYAPSPGAVDVLSRNVIPKDSTTVAMKRVGMGWFGFVGDMEMVDETVAIVLGMLGCDLVATKFP